MNFVNEIHLVASARRCVLHVIEQFARVIDFGPRGRIHLDQIHKSALINFAAGWALAAGARPHARLAIEAFGENTGDGGLTDASGACKQERVVHTIGGKGVRERLQDVFLTG